MEIKSTWTKFRLHLYNGKQTEWYERDKYEEVKSDHKGRIVGVEVNNPEFLM